MLDAHRLHNRITIWHIVLLISSNAFTVSILYIFYTDKQRAGLGAKTPAALLHTIWLSFSCVFTFLSTVALIYYQYQHHLHYPHPIYQYHHEKLSSKADVELGLESFHSAPKPPPKSFYSTFRRQTPATVPAAPPAPPSPPNKRLPKVPAHAPSLSPPPAPEPAYHWMGSNPPIPIPIPIPAWPTQAGADIQEWLPNAYGGRELRMPDGDVQRPSDGRDESLEEDGLGEGDADSVGRITIVNDTGSQRSRRSEDSLETYYVSGVV